MAIFNHLVNLNGVYYPAGTEVPIDGKTPKVEIKAEPTPTYTKTSINKMSKDDLVALAKEKGVADAENKNGNELKESLIETLGL